MNAPADLGDMFTVHVRNPAGTIVRIIGGPWATEASAWLARYSGGDLTATAMDSKGRALQVTT